MTFFFDTFPTPLGEFSLAVDDAGALVATAFGDATALSSRLRVHHALERNATKVAAIREQVREFFAGRRLEFTVPLAPVGTAFQQRVWAALRAIPCGETRSYGELAASLGNPAASRAVGRANATNPICLIVPCHRVIGRDGSLTGFAFGEEIKRRLLEHERGSAISHAA
jgi:methylated-DNA-[protein]-cysteine S-methyltransferase